MVLHLPSLLTAACQQHLGRFPNFNFSLRGSRLYGTGMRQIKVPSKADEEMEFDPIF